MKRLGMAVCLLLAFATVSFGASSAARSLVWNIQTLNSMVGVRPADISSHPLYASAIDSIWGVTDDSTPWLGRSNTLSEGNYFTDTLWGSGAFLGIGDSNTDRAYLYAPLWTRNATGASNWMNIATPGTWTRPAVIHVGAKLKGAASYFDAIFGNAWIDTTAADGSYRGGEFKGTASAATTGTTELIGVYGKVTTTASSGATVPAAHAVHALLENASGTTFTEGSNFYAELGKSGTMTAANVLNCGAGTWTTGINLDAGTFTNDIVLQNGEIIKNSTNNTIDFTTTTAAFSGRVTATDFVASDSLIAVTGDFSGIVSPLSVTLPGGGTIANPASPGTTVTITETNIALAGAVTTTTLAVGSGGTVMTKIVASGADSLGFIVAGDTFWAFSGGVK
jgi:hypothetical protein